MAEHPPSYQLEELAAGLVDENTAKHVQACDACRAYVDRLTQASRAFAELEPSPAAFAARVDATTRGNRRALTIGGAALSIVAAAAAVFFLLRPAQPPAGPIALATATTEAEDPGAVRFKGAPQLAVVRDRGGAQTRLTVEASVRPHDRIRAEIAVDTAGTWEVGVLSKEGAWVTLMPPTMLSPGTHLTPQAVRFDEAPSDGWIIAGAPAAVMRARSTRVFEEVTVIPLRVEKEK